MRRGYKIGLFFVCIMIMALVAVLAWKRYAKGSFSNENAHYDNAGENAGTGAGNSVMELDYTNPGEATDAQDLEAQRVSMVTTCDTICIYENIDKKDGTVSTEEEKLPAKYIGLTRAQLETALLQDSRMLTLEDKEKGFKSQHLELFSPDKIKVLRIYDTSKETTGFYIMEVDGEIGVYREDKETLYFKTGLDPLALPADVLNEVREGKFMDTELQVYHFLESYSS